MKNHSLSIDGECTDRKIYGSFERYEVKNSLRIRSRWLRSCSECLGRYPMGRFGIKNPRGQINVRGEAAIDVESDAGAL